MKNIISFVGALCASNVVKQTIKNNITSTNIIEKAMYYVGGAVISSMVFDSASRYIEKSVNEVEKFVNDFKEGNNVGK